jgi:alginate O-acetyltransferase complex protein AlgI
VKTEITEKKKLNGWVFYDADCRLCVRLAHRFQILLARRNFELLPLQSPWSRVRLGLTEPELLAEMRVITPDGNVLGGADALLEISRHYRLAWPVRQLARLPAIHHLFQQIYRRIARNRSCVNGACEINQTTRRSTSQLTDFLPLLVLPLLALLVRTWLAPWLFMWAMAFALYAGCKWLTYREARRNSVTQNRWRGLGYLLAWPGMNAPEFLRSDVAAANPQRREWLFAFAKTALGFVMLFGLARHFLPAHPLAAGWMGMCGAIFILHFGLFHLLSLAWRRMGVKAEPIMKNPLRAVSLREFWGKRWNTAFNELVFRFAYRSLRRRTTPALAALGVFGLSGLIHELVISLPAGEGFGLPTAYFLIQGIGLVLERSPFGHRIGLARGLRGRMFTVVLTAGPAFWLFHPPFIHHVILPMLHAIGAT